MFKEIVDWQDRQEEKAMEEFAEGKQVKPILRAFGSGAVEGSIIGLAAGGLLSLVLGIVCTISGKKN